MTHIEDERQSLRERLEAAMQSKGFSQRELAQAVGVSPAAVTQWFTRGKGIPEDRMQQVATLLGVSETWLRTGGGAQPDFLTLAMEARNYGWAFRPAPFDGGKAYGNSNIWALPWTPETLTREAIQNILDVTIDPLDGADVTFRLIQLRGEELQAFLRALKYDSGAHPTRTLHPHLEASASNPQKLGLVLAGGLQQLESRRELTLLRVEDRRTRGLVGEEYGPGNFTALTRNDLDSNKSNATAGGSYGLGKAVFPRASQFSTVLFHSTFRQNPADTRLSSRLIGRTDLAYHELTVDQDGQHAATPVRYAGPGWFGEIENGKADEERTGSIWNDPQLVRDLYLARPDNESGTSILVVGFHDPSDETPEKTDLSGLATKLSSAIAENFWPALVQSRLTATVEIHQGEAQEFSGQITVDSHQPINTEMLTEYLNGTTVDRFDQQGNGVVLRRIQLEVPRRKAKSDPHPATTHEAILLVKLLGENDPQTYRDTLSYLRGSNMVIQRRVMKQLVLGARPFQAILLCGLAAGETAENRIAEQFLRTAEPPAHDRWELTPDLKTEYVQGGGKAITDMFEAAKAALRDLVKPEHDELETGPEALRKLLQVGGTGAGPAPTSKPPQLVLDLQKTRLDDQQRWVVEAEIRASNRRAWRVTPVVKFNFDGGGGQRVPWLELVAVSGCQVEDNSIVIPVNSRGARFRGVTDREGHPVTALESTVTVALEGVRIEEVKPA